MLHHRSRKWNGGISKVMTAPHVVARTSSNNGGTSMAKAYPTVLSFIMDFCLELLRCVTFEKFNRVRLLRQSNINFCSFFYQVFHRHEIRCTTIELWICDIFIEMVTIIKCKINETLKRGEENNKIRESLLFAGAYYFGTWLGYFIKKKNDVEER